MIIFWLGVFSFLLNFVWESYHAAGLYQDHNIHAVDYIKMMTFVSIMDVLMVYVIYGITAVIVKDFAWFKVMTKHNIGLFFVIGIVLAYGIEYLMVFVWEWWQYNPHMPTIFGVGISPLLQLSLTGLLAVFISKKLLYR